MKQIDLEELAKFLVRAKRATFAGGSHKTTSCRKNSIDYLFNEENYRYRDSFFGYMHDIGQEIVWADDKPIWGMNYMGGMKNGFWDLSKETFAFLKRCLIKVSSNAPFRGPDTFKSGDFEYRNTYEGDITHFSGTEQIIYNGKEIYNRTYHGGLII